jgi:lysozyme
MLFGLDCASVDDNRNPDWALAKSRGPIAFALVRACYGAEPDPMFATAFPALKAAGLTRGAYLFLRFPRKSSPPPPPPERQAQVFIDTVGSLERSDMPCALDVEFEAGGRAETGFTAEQALDWIRTARGVIAAAYGAAPILYTSARVWHEDLEDLDAPDLIGSPLWLARYYWQERQPARRDASLFDDNLHDPPVPGPWGDADNWWIHQYQGDALGVPGMSSTVDMNRFNALVKGATGRRVAWVQSQLGVVPSGRFDSDTIGAVTAYQRGKGLVVDGVVGPQTFASLCWERRP